MPRFYLRILSCFILLFTVAVASSASQRYVARDRVLFLSEQFANEVLKSPEEAARELDDNRRSLTAVTLEKIKTNQTIEDVITEVRQILLSISSRDKENQTHLKSIISKLSCLDKEVNRDEFQLYFAKEHPDFYRGLDEAHSGLTPRDRRLCALISLGLSTKEIASLTFREVRSVETSRNRLRKKLEIPTDVSLVDYLLRFTSSVAPSDKSDESDVSDPSDKSDPSDTENAAGRGTI